MATMELNQGAPVKKAMRRTCRLGLERTTKVHGFNSVAAAGIIPLRMRIPKAPVPAAGRQPRRYCFNFSA
jgi:hypothetical protein